MSIIFKLLAILLVSMIVIIFGYTMWFQSEMPKGGLSNQ